LIYRQPRGKLVVTGLNNPAVPIVAVNVFAVKKLAVSNMTLSIAIKITIQNPNLIKEGQP